MWPCLTSPGPRHPTSRHEASVVQAANPFASVPPGSESFGTASALLKVDLPGATVDPAASRWEAPVAEYMGTAIGIPAPSRTSWWLQSLLSQRDHVLAWGARKAPPPGLW